MKFFFTKSFLPLFITQFFNAFSDNVFKNALVILITYTIAKDSATTAGIMVTAASGLFILPYFLFSATAGQLADKYDKAKLTRIYKLLEVILMSMAVVGFYFEQMWFLMVVLFAMGTQSTFFGPIKYAILPQLTQDKELMNANALIEGGTFISILLGTITGGILILKDYGVLMLSIVLMLSACIGFAASLKIPYAPGSAPSLKINKNFIAESIKIILTVAKSKTLMLYLLLISWFWLLGSVFLAQIAIFCKEILYVDETVVTLCLTMFSIGIACGAVACNRFSRGQPTMKSVFIGAVGMAISIALIIIFSLNFPQLTDNYANAGTFLMNSRAWLIIISLFSIAFWGGVYTVPLYTLMQRESDKAYIARTVAANNILNSLFMVLSVIIVVIAYKLQFTVLHVFASLSVFNLILAVRIKKGI